jgi:hypothetical protein
MSDPVPEETIVTEPTPEPALSTGPTGPSEPTPEEALPILPTGPSGPAPLPTISIQDILGSVEVSQNRESEDKAKLEAIGVISFETLRSSLLQWATKGFPNAYTIYEVPMTPPNVCSDGVSRSLPDYIVFCSGKTINEHVDVLQQRLIDIAVSFAYTGSVILIVVSKQA